MVGMNANNSGVASFGRCAFDLCYTIGLCLRIGVPCGGASLS